VKPGLQWGATDDYGYYSVEDKVHFPDLHATILHLLGLDHKRLTYRYAGRDFRHGAHCAHTGRGTEALIHPRARDGIPAVVRSLPR
jgi:hypothetical protein